MSKQIKPEINQMTIQELLDEFKTIKEYSNLTNYGIRKKIGGKKLATRDELREKLLGLNDSIVDDHIEISKKSKTKKISKDNQNIKILKHDLREAQKHCLDNINQHFKSNNKGLIKMFCGSGKSLIIHQCLLKYGNELSVLVVPSINLITQFSKDYLNQNNLELLTVCSRDELQQNNSFTTNKDEILRFLNKLGLKIILITYQSLETLFDVVKENPIIINLICFD